MTIRRKSATNQMFAVANLLNLIASIGANYIGAQERARLDALKAENLKLKSKLAHLQQGVVSNRVVEGDLKIELLKLKVEREKWTHQNLGIGLPNFQADSYPDPGNIREENRSS